jgi:hypothetical protein
MHALLTRRLFGEVRAPLLRTPMALELAGGGGDLGRK